MNKTLIALSLLALVLSSFGCERTGLSESEHGKSFVWGDRVDAETPFTATSCAAQFAENPFAEEGAPSLLVYRVSSDGTSITTLECFDDDEEYDPDTFSFSQCEDAVFNLIYEIKDGVFVASSVTLDDSDADCVVETSFSSEVNDRGDTSTLSVQLAFRLVGDPELCTAVNDQLTDETGFGIDGCTRDIDFGVYQLLLIEE